MNKYIYNYICLVSRVILFENFGLFSNENELLNQLIAKTTTHTLKRDGALIRKSGLRYQITFDHFRVCSR